MVCAITQMVAYTYLFSPGSTIEQGRDTVFQRKEHFELHALACFNTKFSEKSNSIYLPEKLSQIIAKIAAMLSMWDR